MKTPDKYKCLFDTAIEFEWDKWAYEIPFLQFPSDWLVKAIPPRITGVIRYNIKHVDGGFVSVYLDCYDMAGYMGKPYWEIYPDIHGNANRFWLNETDELLASIAESLADQIAKQKAGQ